MKKRVLVLEFRQENNTFNPIVTEMSYFRGGEGAAVLESNMKINSSVHGAVDALAEADIQVIPSVFFRTNSGGPVADEVLNHVCERAVYYAKTEEYDAIFASLHGATCSENEDDACGFLMELLREIAGDKPIAASFDLHGKITEKVLKNVDIICGYQTYPHRDHYETGYRAGALLAKMLNNERFYMASAAIPMLIPPAGFTSEEGKFKQMEDWGKQQVAEGKLLDYTVFAVQPWLDVPEIASRTIAIAKDPETAKSYADALAQKLCDLRDETMPELLSVDEIIDIAEKNTSGKPVVLSEFADSPNGGCAGDSPVVAMRLLERGSKLRAGMFIRDPEAVEQAFRLGIGGVAQFRAGAKFTPGMPGPLVAEGTVCSLHDGNFILEGPANRGVASSVGRAAVVRFGTIDVLLCSKGGGSGDPQIFRHFGIEPTMYDLIVVKANTSFRLPYGKMTDLMYSADTVGAGAANLKKLHWEKIPEGLYPFVHDISPEKAKIW